MKDTLRLFRKDILIRPVDKNLLSKSVIQIYGTDRQAATNDVQYYEVLSTGPDCREIKKGDTVMMKWIDTMPMFELDGKKTTLTDESRVMGICEL